MGATGEATSIDTRVVRRDGVPVRVAVLGPLLVDGDPLALTRRDRVVLAALVLHLGDPVRSDTLAEALWGDAPPPSAPKVLQGCVLRLRRTLGATAVETVGRGYRLLLHRDDVDCTLADDLVGRAGAFLAEDQHDRAGYLLARASELFRGEPYPDLVDWEPAAAERERLVELRRDLEELRAEARLAAGDHAGAIPTLRALVAEAPTREHRWELLALAEYRGGRQAEALETTRRARRLLDEELGLEAGPTLVALEAALLRQDPALEAPAVEPESGACPYPGLLPYEVSDSEAFFGREDGVAAALRTLDRAGVVTVAGPSGCGKSSLLRAGVAAALSRDGRDVVVVTPGGWPRVLEVAPSGALVVDQLEELFDAEPAIRERVLRAVEEHGRSGGLLAMALRADRVGELATFPTIARLVESGLLLLGGMTEDELRRAVLGPAEQAGLRLEPGLVELLVREVLGEPAALPLLSHVLQETWALREGRTLTVAGYHSTGGVQGAVSRSAEAVYDELGPDERHLLKQVMTRLVTTGEEGVPARRRVPVAYVEGDERRHVLVERLLDARLLSSDGQVVEIAHESLTQAWPRLRSWLDEDVEGQQVMRHLAVAAETWDQAGRPDSELYRGQREQRARQWRDDVGPDLTAVETAFLDASTALARDEAEAAEERARRDRVVNRRLRLGLAAVLVLALVATVAGAIAATSARRTAQALVVADARRLGSEALRAKDLDTSLLYAVAAMRLDDSIDTRSDLLAAIDKAPTLLTMARIPGVTGLAMSARENVLFALSPEHALTVLDADTLRTVRELPDVTGAAVVSSPDGSFSVATMSPGAARSGGRPVVLLEPSGALADRQLGNAPEKGYVFTDLSVSPDNAHVAMTFHRDGGARPVIGVWDERAPEEPVTLIATDEWSAPVVDVTGRRMLVVGPRGLGVLDLPEGNQRRVLSADDLRLPDEEMTLALSADGRLLAVGAGTQVVLLDARSLDRRGRLTVPGGVGRLAFSFSGRLLAVSGDDTTVFDVSTVDAPVEVFWHQTGRPNGWVSRVGFSADEATLYTSDWEGSVRAWDLGGGRGFLSARRSADVGSEQGTGRFSADGRYVLHHDFSPGFVVEDLADGSTSRHVDTGMTPNGSIDLAISSDGQLVTMTTSDPRVAVWDDEGYLVAATSLPSGEGASFSWFTDDGGLVVGTTRGRIHVFDARTLEPRRPPIDATPDEVIYAFALRPDGREVLVLTGEGTVVDLVTGDIRPSTLGIDGFSAAYSPDGSRLAVSTGDGSVGLWDVEGSRWTKEPTDAVSLGGAIPVFSPGGREFALISSGRAGRWDGVTGAFLGSVTVGVDGGPGYTQDGSRLLVAGQDGRVYTWDLDPESWVAAACRMAGRDLTEQEWAAQMPDRSQEPVCPSAPVT
jgi:DNA-binding SARP family transcriptional activator/WD40 repeat protein